MGTKRLESEKKKHKGAHVSNYARPLFYLWPKRKKTNKRPRIDLLWHKHKTVILFLVSIIFLCVLTEVCFPVFIHHVVSK